MTLLNTISPTNISTLHAILLLTGLLLLLASTYILGSCIYNIYFHPLRSFPGPKLFAASRLPFITAGLSGHLPHTVRRLHAQYGPVVRLTPDTLTFTEPAAWKDIYGHRQGHPQHPKTMRPSAQKGHAFNIINNPSDADHARQRKLLASAFSAKAMEEQQPIIMVYVDLLIQRLHENAPKGPLDIGAWYTFTTFDVIGDLSFGESFGCLASSAAHPWVHSFHRLIRGSFILVSLQRLGLARFTRLLAPKSLMEQRAAHFNYAHVAVGKRLEQDSRDDGRRDIISHMLKEGEELTRAEIEPNCSTLVIAGSETTATLLHGVTYYLLRNPKVLAKTVAEVRGSFKADAEIDLLSVAKLEYMLAVLNEALRMYPPVPQGLPRRIEGADGDVVAGRWVPPDTIVSVYQWAANYSPDNFHQPNSFIPERWLEGSGSKRDNEDPLLRGFAADKRDAMQPFSTGPRNCIGKNLAYAEMRLILARVLWNFDLTLEDESANWTDQRAFVLWEKPPLMVTLKPVEGKR